MTWSAELRRRRLLPALAGAVCALVLPHRARAQDDALAPLRAAVATGWGVAADAVQLELDSALLQLADAGVTLRAGQLGTDGRLLVQAGTRSGWARAGLATRVPVATRALGRGEVVARDAFRVESRVLWGSPSAVDTVLAGWVVGRALAPGSPLVQPAVRPASAVRAGDDLKLVLEQGAVRVQLRGIAAGTGAIGDTIAVRAQGGKRLRAVIREPGTVSLLGTREIS